MNGLQHSLYDAAIPSYREGLTGLAGILAKAAIHLDGRNEGWLLRQSLAERLYPLGAQVVAACGHAEKDPALVAGIEFPARGAATMTMDGLRSRVAAALEFLRDIPADRINRGIDRAIPHGGHAMKGSEYLLRHSLPHFFFHLTIVYVTLRQNGVPIGKADFLGNARTGIAA